MSWFVKAEEKLSRELKEGKFDRYGNAMKTEIKETLLEFCRQDEEFAQAVAQGGSFSECMTAVVKKVQHGAISDLKANKAAVGFYFPGAEIRMEMHIDLIGHAAAQENKGGVVLDLSAFF